MLVEDYDTFHVVAVVVGDCGGDDDDDADEGWKECK